MQNSAHIADMLRASQREREAMIHDQIAARGVQDARVLAALRAIPRELFVPPELRDEAYADRALPIGPGQTISQPFIVAYMTQQLDVLPRDRVLEVGTGTGYQSALLARLAGTVDTIECDAALANLAENRLRLLHAANVRFHVGDGSAGLPDASPFDRIMVTAACPAVPHVLVSQLADGGVLLAPIGGEDAQTLVRVSRRAGQVYADRLLECRFVKLVGRFGWPG